MNVQGLVAIRHLTQAPTAFIRGHATYRLHYWTTPNDFMRAYAFDAHAISKCPRALFICYCF